MIPSANKKIHRETLAIFIDKLQTMGRYTFSRSEAMAQLQYSDAAFKHAARRLIIKQRIVAPRRGFFVIVPVEYRRSEAPPPSWFIDDLMRFQKKTYYVGLLSAAAIYGAAHQKSQEFQVITNTALRPVVAGKVLIRFFKKKALSDTRTQLVKTETGNMIVSSPEATAFDLVRYVEHVGHFGNVVTVLRELRERLDARRLLQVAKTGTELTCVQRLGYLLEYFVDDAKLFTPLAEWLRTQNPTLILLRPERDDVGRKDERWKIVVNDEISTDDL